VDGQPVPYSRQHHLIIADENVLLEHGQQTEVEITYTGSINENLCYLDIPETGTAAEIREICTECG
jgi:hypothetical protein